MRQLGASFPLAGKRPEVGRVSPFDVLLSLVDSVVGRVGVDPSHQPDELLPAEFRPARAARDALDAHAAVLSPANMDWLRQLPYIDKLNEIDVHLCHGSPVRIEEFEYIFAPEQARECLPIYDDLADLTLIGHSHLCKVFALTPSSVEELPPIDFALEPDKKYIVSVGSVGQPRDYDNRASYTVYDTDKRVFEFKRIEYDIETAADKVLRARLERNFAHRLFIGV